LEASGRNKAQTTWFKLHPTPAQCQPSPGQNPRGCRSCRSAVVTLPKRDGFLWTPPRKRDILTFEWYRFLANWYNRDGTKIEDLSMLFFTHESRFKISIFRGTIILVSFSYGIFLLFWLFWLHMSPTGIVDGIYGMDKDTYPGVSPWAHPIKEGFIEVDGVGYERYKIRNGEVTTFFYHVQFTQILPDDSDIPRVVQWHFSRRLWPILSGPLLSTILIFPVFSIILCYRRSS